MTEMSTDTETFKAPFLGPSDTQICVTDTSNDPENGENKLEKSEKKTAAKKVTNISLPYEEPEWAGTPPANFNFEIIKNGTYFSTLPIKTSCMVFGRLEVCDVMFQHPSVSRYHAIVQYCRGDDTHPKGFYLYDLGSTHGTFLNKNPVKSKIYYKLKVGYVLKFGGSSRLHIFQGPEDEEEENKDKQPESKVESEECNWGMGEDAEEEESENSINPFALSTPNEELYLDDPKKTLRGWFEREGYELEYDVQEKGFKTFACTVKLPVDTPTGDFLPVEASVSGKKKEAVVACALEACRTLDRLGLLRQSHQESRQQKKKKWEENDFYDSDEDTFYDRTGEIEKRREMRKRLAKKVEVDNFQTIKEKLEALNAEITEATKKLAACTNKKSKCANSAEDDSLEMFMSNLAESSEAPTDKFVRRKLMLRLAEAEKEKAHLEKLLDIARPAKLPPVGKHPGMIGKRPKSKLQIPLKSKLVKTTCLKSKPNQIKSPSDSKKDDIEEVESDTDINDNEKPGNASHVESMHIDEWGSDIIIKKCEPILSDNTDKKENFTTRKEEEHHVSKPNVEKMHIDDSDSNNAPKKYGLSMPGENDRKNCFGFSEVQKEKLDPVNLENNVSICEADTTIEKAINSEVEDKSGSPSLNSKPVKKSNIKKQKKDVDVYKTDTAEYTTWVPPSNQTGDGMTHLNAKYGY